MQISGACEVRPPLRSFAWHLLFGNLKLTHTAGGGIASAMVTALGVRRARWQTAVAQALAVRANGGSGKQLCPLVPTASCRFRTRLVAFDETRGELWSSISGIVEHGFEFWNGTLRREFALFWNSAYENLPGFPVVLRKEG